MTTEPTPEEQADVDAQAEAGAEPSSHETAHDDPAGQVAETFPGTSTDPQAAGADVEDSSSST